MAKVPIINPSGIRWDNKKKIAKAFDLGLWSFKLKINSSWSCLVSFSEFIAFPLKCLAKKYFSPNENSNPTKIREAIIIPVIVLAKTILSEKIVINSSSKWVFDSPMNRTVDIIIKKPEEKAYKYLYALGLILGLNIGKQIP